MREMFMDMRLILVEGGLSLQVASDDQKLIIVIQMSSGNVYFLEVHQTLTKLLEEGLGLIEVEQFIKDPPFSSLLQAIQNISQFNGTITDLTKDLLHKFTEVNHYISHKSKLLVDFCVSEMINLQEKIKSMQSEMHRQRERVDSLQQDKQKQLKMLAEWQYENEAIETEYSNRVANLEREKKQVKWEMEEVKRTAQQVMEENENYRILLENMQEQKTSLTHKLETQRRNNQTLLQSLKQQQQKLTGSQRQINCLASKLERKKKRMVELLEDLKEKQRIIQEIKKTQLQNRSFQEQKINYELPHLQKQKTSSQNTTTFKISDQIGNPQSDYIFLQRSYSIKPVESPTIKPIKSHLETHIPFYIFQQEEKAIKVDVLVEMRPILTQQSGVINLEVFPTKKLTKNVQNQTENQLNSNQSQTESIISNKGAGPDFYFAHYLLTVQSMKLKLGKQDLFTIDMKEQKYYWEMINRGTPLHQWDDWIKAKLLELTEKSN